MYLQHKNNQTNFLIKINKFLQQEKINRNSRKLNKYLANHKGNIKNILNRFVNKEILFGYFEIFMYCSEEILVDYFEKLFSL